MLDSHPSQYTVLNVDRAVEVFNTSGSPQQLSQTKTMLLRGVKQTDLSLIDMSKTVEVPITIDPLKIVNNNAYSSDPNVVGKSMIEFCVLFMLNTLQ